jgi:hypothetical protein
VELVDGVMMYDHHHSQAWLQLEILGFLWMAKDVEIVIRWLKFIQKHAKYMCCEIVVKKLISCQLEILVVKGSDYTGCGVFTFKCQGIVVKEK